MTTAMLTKAVRWARMNTVEGLPKLAAILVTKYGEEYVGLNSRKTHPLAAKFGRNSKSICLHAEVDAIRRALRDYSSLEGAKMYVARVDKGGNPRLARPCTGCQRAIVAFGIEEVEWTE